MSYLNNIMVMLRSKTGHDFSSYKEKTVCRRIERHMAAHQVDGLDAYVRFLQENPRELESLFKELLIGVTHFFRDPVEWDLLKDNVIPRLFAERTPNDSIRVWVSGCSTGEEAYSLAIVFREMMEQLKCQDYPVQIFATDLDIDAINKAREGFFSASIEEDMPLERLSRYFEKAAGGYQVGKTIRNMVIFAQQNMVMDPPFTKLDLLICRNMLIYLTPEMQKKLIPLFHYCLNPGGFLFLGSAEAIINFTELFQPMYRRSRIYRRLQPLFQAETVELSTSFAPTRPTTNKTSEMRQNVKSHMDQLILRDYAPAAVLVNSAGDILYMAGPTDKYLKVAVGNSNWNILAVVREGLKCKLRNAFNNVLLQKEAVIFKNTIVISEGETQIIDISISLLKEPKALRGMIMIVFTDVVTPDVFKALSTTGGIPASSQQEAELERELMLTRQMWQAASTEMQVYQEELESSNEELQATNEELQSINEELTTIKEEALLSNEELKTVNFELQDKYEGLSMVTENVKNQMECMNIAALFLDNTLCVKHFTSQMAVIYRLISGDVGRPVTDIASDLIYPELEEDVNEVLHMRSSIEKQIPSVNGNWYRAHIIPYRTLEGKIDGAVITFIDITKFVDAQSDIAEATACNDLQHDKP